MILIADGGSTKVDWMVLNTHQEVVCKVRTLGLNPSVVPEKELAKRIESAPELIGIKNRVTHIYFYGAGCGTSKKAAILSKVFGAIFVKAQIVVAEDMLAAVYATAGNQPAIVCILGTGSNSCYYNGKDIQTLAPSLGYSIMDEASGCYFGRELLRDYFYNKMPKAIAQSFETDYNLEVDFVKSNLYHNPNPNRYLASLAGFMINLKEEPYIQNIIKKGFQKFFECRVIPFNKNAKTPIYFVGSIAFEYQNLLKAVAETYHLKIADIVQRPIDNLLLYHKNQMLS